MDEFLADLRELDETQERVEAVSDGMLRAQEDGDTERAREMVAHWIGALRASDFQAERVAFLYVANHVLQKTLVGDQPVDSPVYVDLLWENLEEAVALVSNSPMDRQNVTRLLELWHEKAMFSDEQVMKLWKCTGEELPLFLAQVAANKNADATVADTDMETDAPVDGDGQNMSLPSALPMKLNAHSANPVLDALKQIDHHKAVVQYLDHQIQERHRETMTMAADMYQTAEDLLADHSTTPMRMKQRVEDCLRLVKVRNKFAQETEKLKQQLEKAIASMIEEEEAAGSKIELKLEQCDLIDIGLADLAEHRDKYPEEWSRAAYVCIERRKQREEEQRQREQEMARLHQEALAESAAHALHLEADINAASSSELHSLSKELDGRTEEQEAKHDQSNEMVWHPVLKELVPLQSLNVEWESWRDH